MAKRKDIKLEFSMNRIIWFANRVSVMRVTDRVHSALQTQTNWVLKLLNLGVWHSDCIIFLKKISCWHWNVNGMNNKVFEAYTLHTALFWEIETVHKSENICPKYSTSFHYFCNYWKIDKNHWIEQNKSWVFSELGEFLNQLDYQWLY